MVIKKQSPYTLSGFDLTTHNTVGRDKTTRPRRQGMLCREMAISRDNKLEKISEPGVDPTIMSSNPTSSQVHFEN
jgi:hypothetical protein